MQRIDFYLSYNDRTLDQRLEQVIDRLTWLKDSFGDGDAWPNQTYFTSTPTLTRRWAFGNYQPTVMHTPRFCLWIPDDIRLLYDIVWPN